MASVGTVSATLVGPGVAHGLTRASFITPGSAVPTPLDVTNALAALDEFWTAITANVVAGVVVTFNDAAVVRDVATGLTTDEVTATTIPLPITMTDTSPESVSGAGARIDWRTGIRRGSREVRGATFVIPMGSGQYTSTGEVNSACRSTLTLAADGMVASFLGSGLVLVVYGRPLPATTHHGPLAGITASITAAEVSGTPGFLRRRRS